MIFEQMVGPTKIELKSNSKRKARLNRCEKLMCYNKNKMYDSKNDYLAHRNNCTIARNFPKSHRTGIISSTIQSLLLKD